MNHLDVIRAPIITEKLDKAQEALNQFTFSVDRQATKRDIRDAVQRLFKVTVTGVRTAIVRGKNKRIGRSSGRRPNYKKAMVTLKKGDTIGLFKGTA